MDIPRTLLKLNVIHIRNTLNASEHTGSMQLKHKSIIDGFTVLLCDYTARHLDRRM